MSATDPLTIIIQSSLPILLFLGLAKTSSIPKRQYWEYNLKKPYLGLEMGGGIGREAILGGTTVLQT